MSVVVQVEFHENKKIVTFENISLSDLGNDQVLAFINKVRKDNALVEATEGERAVQEKCRRAFIKIIYMMVFLSTFVFDTGILGVVVGYMALNQLRDRHHKLDVNESSDIVETPVIKIPESVSIPIPPVPRMPSPAPSDDTAVSVISPATVASSPTLMSSTASHRDKFLEEIRNAKLRRRQ